MTKFIGNGVYKPYSREVDLDQPILVRDLGKFLNIPKDLSDNLIVVRQSQILGSEEQIHNNEEILFFFAAMGG
jgi:hypothetical protein